MSGRESSKRQSATRRRSPPEILATSASAPAMIRSSDDFPAPLAPSTPIFAPWKNDSQIPRKISRLGGTTFFRSFITYAYSPAMGATVPQRPCLDKLGTGSQHDAGD